MSASHAEDTMPDTGRSYAAASDVVVPSDRFADLARLSATWQGYDPTMIAEVVLKALRNMLQLDFVGLRFAATSHVFLRMNSAISEAGAETEAREAISHLLDTSGRSAEMSPVTFAGRRFHVAHVPMGAAASIGDIVAGAARASFPDEQERSLLALAAMLAALACREIRAESERSPPEDLRGEPLSVDALAESERRLRLIIDTIPAMAWSSTPDGLLDFVNQYFLDYIGNDFSAVGGLNFYAIFHPDDRDNLLSTWQRTMVDRRGHEVEGRIRRADGAYRWFVFRQNPLLDAAGNVVKWYGVISDVEDRKRAEQSLRASEEALASSERNLNLIIDSLPIFSFSARLDGSADFINKQYQDYVGLPPERILDWGYVDCWHPDDVEPMMRCWSEDLKGDFATNRGRIRKHDGSYRWFYFAARKIVDANGAMRWFGVAVDIEDLQQAEDALKASSAALQTSERMLQQIVSTIPGLVWAADPEGGTTYWSEQYLAYTGMRMEQVLGTGFHEHLHPDDRQRVIDFAVATVRSGISDEIEARLRQAEGRYRWFLIRANPFYDEAGKLTQWFGVNIDIDERIRAEAQLRQAEAELARVTRAVTIGELAVSIAHEINQPLMAPCPRQTRTTKRTCRPARGTACTLRNAHRTRARSHGPRRGRSTEQAGGG